MLFPCFIQTELLRCIFALEVNLIDLKLTTLKQSLSDLWSNT